MKRFLISLLLLSVTLLTNHAQDCFFQYQGKPLADDETIIIVAEEDPIFGDFECNTNPASNPSNGLFFINNGTKLSILGFQFLYSFKKLLTFY